MSYFECFSVTVPRMMIESTFFILNVRLVFVRNWVFLYTNENAKRSAESILMLYIYFPLSFPKTLLKYNKYQLTKRCLEGKLEEISSEFLKNMWLIEYRTLRNIRIFIIVVHGCIVIIHEVFTCDSTQ